MIKLASLIYIFFFLYLYLESVKGEYPVIIDDPSIKFSPRQYGRSTVVYNNKMYVYGGLSVASVSFSNKMYVYDFESDPNAARMSLVNQTNAGPICVFCGAVMINETHMMMLTKDYYNEYYPQFENDTIVRPFIFDFETLTWSIDNRDPIYDISLEYVFNARIEHSTIVGNDGMIYTIGGVDIDGEQYQGISWYYNRTDNSYHIISSYDGMPYFVVGSISFMLSDTTIGSMYGRSGEGYYEQGLVNVLDIVSKSWLEPQRIQVISNYTPGFEGATAQVISNKNLVYIYGGSYDNGDGSLTTLCTATELNLNQNTSTVIIDYPNDYFGTPRIYGSSAIISEKYLVLGFGYSKSGSSEVKGLDIMRLPEEKLEGENYSLEAEWITSMSSTSPVVSDKKISTATILFIIFCILAAICLGFIILALVNRRKLSGKNRFGKNETYVFGFFKLMWPQRLGETFSSQLYNFSARIILCMVLLAFIVYFVYSIINSSISSTESFVEKENMTFPDVRFCYSGWDYTYIRDDIDEQFPELYCQNYDAGTTGCGEIVTLNRSILSPSFSEREDSIKCYMYQSSRNTSVVNKKASVIQLYHSGSYTSKGQLVYIQLYEPAKNPNRVVYLNQSLPGFDSDTIDDWIDSERVSGSQNEVTHQVLTVYPDSFVSAQFEIVHSYKIDPNNAWNLIGIFPKYLYTSELSITHTAVMSGNTNINESYSEFKAFLGQIELSPASFSVKTITEKRDVTVVSTLGVFSGVVSMLLAAQMFLFGAKPTDPWGIFQKASVRAYQKQKKKEELEKYFYIPDVESVPFVTPVHRRFSDIHSLNSQQMYERRFSMKGNLETEVMNRRSYTEGYPSLENKDVFESSSSVCKLDDIEARLSQLEGRNQILELVLKAYYIDDKIFHELYSPRVDDEEIAPAMERIDSGKIV